MLIITSCFAGIPIASFLALVSLSVVMFASTNIDDLFVLLGYFAERKYSTRDIVLGQFLGIGALYGASVILAVGARGFPVMLVGLLGLVPLAIGIGKLRDLWNGKEDTKEKKERPGDKKINKDVLTVAAVTVANGGDNIGTYVPVFAFHSVGEAIFIGVIFMMLTAVWCQTALYMVNRPKLREPLRQYGQWIAPCVLVVLGLIIMHDAGLLRPIGL